jgi:DNA-binding CsgD family transcriptional regulator
MAKAQSRFAARYPNLLVRPCILAGTRWDAVAGWICCAALGAILVVEVVTPNDVVISLALLPLMAAMWALSTPLALRVALASAAVFGIVLATEVGNRPTVIFVAAVAVVLGGVVRFYAIGLARLWPAARLAPLALTASGPVDSLTLRELQVATLASRGYTAAEIGSRLHISGRTVESHLANAYGKLAIHSRSELRHLSELVS